MQPAAFVAVTLYCMVAVGRTVTLAPVLPKSGHSKVTPVAPEAVKVTSSPLQISVLVAAMVGAAKVFTVTVFEAVAVQPLASVRVTV